MKLAQGLFLYFLTKGLGYCQNVSECLTCNNNSCPRGLQCRVTWGSGRQLIVFMFVNMCPFWQRYFKVHYGSWTPPSVCAFTSSLYSQYEFDGSHSRVDQDYHCCELLKDQPLYFCGPIDTLSIFPTGLTICTWSVFSCVRVKQKGK